MKGTHDDLKPDKKGKDWLSYVDYCNGLVIQGITNAIDSSMHSLAEEICIEKNKSEDKQPIFDIKVCLDQKSVQFDPSITCNSNGTGIRDIINKITENFISLATTMPSRLDAATGETGGDYLVEIKDQFQIFGRMQTISNHLNAIEKASEDFLTQYDQLKFLWEEELEESFQKFLDSGPDLRETFEEQLKQQRDGEDQDTDWYDEEMDSFKAMAEKILHGVNTRNPSLNAFDEKITFLHEQQQNISKIKKTQDIGWIKVNSQPLINDLEKLIDSWINKFTQYLLHSTKRQLFNIRKFITDVNNGLKELPQNLKT